MKKIRFYFGISILWLALSMLFDGINTLILPARISSLVDKSHQASALGIVSFAGLLAGLLVQPVAGAVSDQWRSQIGRKGFLAAGVCLSLVFLTFFGLSVSLPVLAASYLLVQVSGSITQAAQQGWIPDLVPAHSRGKASGWKAFMDIGGAMVGFVLLGQFLGNGRAGAATAVLGLALVAAFILTFLLVRERRTPVTDRKTKNIRMPESVFTGAFRLGFKEHRAFAWLVASRFLFLLGTYAMGRFLLYFVASRLGLGLDEAAKQTGGLLAGLALVTVLGAPLAGWASDRWGRIPVILFGALISAVGVTLLIFASSLGQIFAFGMLMSLGSAAFASANWALTADLVPRAEAARYFGLANIGTAGAAAVAGLFGPLVDWGNTIQPGAGYPVLFLISALVFVLSALTLRWVKQPTSASQPMWYTGLNKEEL